MPWKTEDRYEVLFFPLFGEPEFVRIYVAINEKEARKAFKEIVSQWKRGKEIVYDAFAVRAKEVEAIILTSRTQLVHKP